MKKSGQVLIRAIFVIFMAFLVACSGGGGGGGGNNNSPTPTPTPPTAPSGLTATAASSSQIDLTWTDNSSNETGFMIERKTGVAGTYSQITTVTAGVTSYRNTGLTVSTTYYYQVSAYNTSGNSTYSNEASATTEGAGYTNPCDNPGSSYNLSVGNSDTYSTSGLINYWSSYSIVPVWDESGPEYCYIVNAPSGFTATLSGMSVDLDVFILTAKNSNSASAYGNTSAAVGTSGMYYVIVDGFNGAQGSYTITLAAGAVPVPAAPSGLTATALGNTAIYLAWIDNSSNETGFKIERKTGVAGTYSKVVEVAADSTWVSNGGLSPGTTYYYRINAYNASGDSTYSNEASATTTGAGYTNPCDDPASSSTLSVGNSDTYSTSGLINYWSSYSIVPDWDWSGPEYCYIINAPSGFTATLSGMSSDLDVFILTSKNSNSAVAYGDTNATVGPSGVYYVIVDGYGVAQGSYTITLTAASGPMISIPAGCFNMGDSFGEGMSDELPVHNVCLSAFSISRHEVTVGEYKQCAAVGACTVPWILDSATRPFYYSPGSTYDNYPVIYVDWNQAKAYCTWIGGRLPTEAEWEKAARGGLSGKRYPNGDTISCADANFERGGSSGICWNYGGLANDTHAVESYAPNGYGLYDMAGNVVEWANDWYLNTYYSVSPTNDPQGPASGTYRITRGGWWSFTAYPLRASSRPRDNPTMRSGFRGFRCAK